MKVSTCTQVFSHTYAVAINVLSKSGMSVETDGEILRIGLYTGDTASLLEFLGQLFDSLNGSSFTVKKGKTLRVAVTATSPHKKVWNEAISVLETFKYLNNERYVIPPSVSNLIKTIKNLSILFEKLKVLGLNSLMPRTFNQDPFENFFGKVRKRGHRFTNPTVASFTPIYKSLLVNGMASGHSVGANCEDNSEICLTLQRLVSQGLPEDTDDLSVLYSQVPKDVNIPTKGIELKILKYVSGYILKKN